VNGVWYSMPAADLLSSIIAAVMLIHQFRQFKKKEAKNEIHPNINI